MWPLLLIIPAVSLFSKSQTGSYNPLALLHPPLSKAPPADVPHPSPAALNPTLTVDGKGTGVIPETPIDKSDGVFRPPLGIPVPGLTVDGHGTGVIPENPVDNSNGSTLGKMLAGAALNAQQLADAIASGGPKS